MRLKSGFILITTLVALAASSDAKAGPDYFNCNGVISNRPCDELEKASSGPTIEPGSKRAISEIKGILHDIQIRNFDAKRRYNVSVDLSKVEEICSPKSADLEKCRSVASSTDLELSQRIAREREVRAQETQAAKQLVTPQASSNNKVIVIQNNVIVREPTVFPTPVRPEKPNNGVPPIGVPPKPGADIKHPIELVR